MPGRHQLLGQSLPEIDNVMMKFRASISLGSHSSRYTCRYRSQLYVVFLSQCRHDLEHYCTRHGIPNGRKDTIDDEVAGLDYVTALWSLQA
jgi:hypothetical protein